MDCFSQLFQFPMSPHQKEALLNLNLNFLYLNDNFHLREKSVVKVSKFQKQIRFFSFSPKHEQKYFCDSALEAEAELEKDFCSFFGGNKKKRICF